MQIPQDKRVRQYELTYLVPATLTSDEVNQVDAAIEKLVKKHKGTVISKEDWGKRTLAYTILTAGKRHTEAVYKFCVLEFETSNTDAFEKDVYLNQSIIRHLMIIAQPMTAKPSEAVQSRDEA